MGYDIKSLQLDKTAVFRIIDLSQIPSLYQLTSTTEVHHGASSQNGPIIFRKGSGSYVLSLLEAGVGPRKEPS